MRIADHSRLKRSGKAGYTLTEMLVVIAVIGLIAAVLTPNLLSQLSRAKAKAAQLQLKTVASAVALFRDDVGRLPTTAEGLTALIEQPSGAETWTGPYLEDAAALSDPWGNKILYTLKPGGQGFFVQTLGADGEPGGKGADRDLQAPAR
jgi:general secretion pathway protein G